VTLRFLDPLAFFSVLPMFLSLVYKLCTNQIAVPKIEDVFEIDNFNKMIIYQYENTIKYNGGLLCDVLNNDTSFQDYVRMLDSTLSPYWSLADKTGDLTECISYKKFVKDRISTRYNDWYINNDSLQALLIKFRGKDYAISEILNHVKVFISNFNPLRGILSHGDPGDLNIGVKPIFFDLETFGFNPFALEFATFFWNVFLGGDYFFPIYHNSKYVFHNNVYRDIHKIDIKYLWNNNVIDVQKLRINLSKKRLYTLHTILKLFSHINDTFKINATDDEIICLLIFRVLTIINYHAMSLKDKALLLTITAIIYEGIEHNAFSHLKYMLDSFNEEIVL